MSSTDTFNYKTLKKELYELAQNTYPRSMPKAVCQNVKILLSLLRKITSYVFDDRIFQILDFLSRLSFNSVIHLKCICGECDSSCHYQKSCSSYLTRMPDLHNYWLTGIKIPEYVDACVPIIAKFPEKTVTNDICRYGKTCLNFRDGICVLRHPGVCSYFSECKNFARGECPLEH